MTLSLIVAAHSLPPSRLPPFAGSGSLAAMATFESSIHTKYGSMYSICVSLFVVARLTSPSPHIPLPHHCHCLLQREEAMQLVRDAIAAGIFNDLVSRLVILFKQYCYTMKHSLVSPQGSGSNIDLCVITADKTEYLRPFDVANLKGQRYLGTERCGLQTYHLERNLDHVIMSNISVQGWRLPLPTWYNSRP